MAVTINSNSAALNAQRRLGDVTSQLTKTSERLSSGLRINRAADDAAGLSISESLKADQRVFSQGVRNLNDGISLLAVADGALDTLSNITIRLKELAEQAANGVYGTNQRKALDKEAQVLAKEYVRIAQTTKFNGLDLFTGALGNVRLQAGFNVDGGISAGLGGAIGDGTLGSVIPQSPISTTYNDSGDFNGDGILDLVSTNAGLAFYVHLGIGNGTFQTAVSYTTSGVAALGVAAADFNGDGIYDVAVSDPSGGAGSIWFGNGNGTFRVGSTTISFSGGGGPYWIDSADVNGDGLADLIGSSGIGNGSIKLGIGNGDGTFRITSVASSGGPQTPTSAVFGDFNGDGAIDIAGLYSNNTIAVALNRGNGTFAASVSYTVGTGSSITTGDYNGDGILDLVNVGGGSVDLLLGTGSGGFQARIAFAEASNPTQVVSGDFNGDGRSDLLTSGASTKILLGQGDGTFSASYSSATITSGILGDFNGDGVLDAVASNGVRLGGATDGVGAILTFDLTSIAGARQALPMFDRKIQQLANQRGKIGAFESRVSAALNAVGISAENYAEANSRIRDADVADEAAKLARLKILQQSAAAVLAQANRQPSLALNLLKSNG